MPKRYRVETVPLADADISSIHDRIAQDKPRAATKWARELRRHIRSLRTFPERYEIIPEAPQMADSHRHIIFGNYRVIYRVEPKRVLVLRVVNAAQVLHSSMLPKA